MITNDKLETTLTELKQQRVRQEQLLLTIQGAIQLCEYLLQDHVTAPVTSAAPQE